MVLELKRTTLLLMGLQKLFNANNCGGSESHRKGPEDILLPVRRALVVDACVGDLSSPHLHPVFWHPAEGFTNNTHSSSSSSAVPTSRFSSASTIPLGGDKRGGVGRAPDGVGLDPLLSGWRALQPGWSEVWGRTCMEFDILLGTTYPT